MFAVNSVGDGSSDDAALRVGGPELLTVVSTIGFKVPLRGAFKDQIARSGEESAVRWGLAIHAPDFFLLQGIPGGKVSFDGGEDCFLDLRLLRHACGHEIDADIKSESALTGMLPGFVKEAAIRDRDIGQAGERAEGHRVPSVTAVRSGDERRTGLLIFVKGGGIEDGAACFQINGTGPGDGGVRLCGKQLAGGAVEDVEETVLGSVKQNFSRGVVDREVGKDDGLVGIVIPCVAGSLLIMPDVFAGVGFERDDRADEEIVAASRAASGPVPRSAIADTEVDEIELGVVGDGVPDGAASADVPPPAGPGFCGFFENGSFEGLCRIAGYSVEPPSHFSSVGIVGGDVTAHAVFGSTIAD